MESCIFCKIVKGEIPCLKIDETDRLIVFLSLEGHPLVVPKDHILDIYAFNDRELGGLLMEECSLVARAVKNGLNCDGVRVTQANGESAGQTVFHLHFHIYPHWKKPTTQDLGKEEIRLVTTEKIKEALLAMRK